MVNVNVSICENGKSIKSVADTSVILGDEITNVTDSVSTNVAKTIRTNMTNTIPTNVRSTVQ